jgi:hypothetical protein
VALAGALVALVLSVVIVPVATAAGPGSSPVSPTDCSYAVHYSWIVAHEFGDDTWGDNTWQRTAMLGNPPAFCGPGRPFTRTIDSYQAATVWKWVDGQAVNGRSTKAVMRSVDCWIVMKCVRFLSVHGESGSGHWVAYVW